MKPINIQNVDKYPENYDWLSLEQQETIYNYMNRVQALANHYFAKYFYLDLNKDKKDLSLYQHTLTSLTGAKNAYATLGIMIEYDWPGHKKEWFLANKEDAENYINTEETIPDESVVDEIKKLIEYGDIL